MLWSLTEEGIRADIRSRQGPAYYRDVRENDKSFPTRAVNWFGRHWKKFALGATGGFGLAFAPYLVLSLASASPATMAAAGTFGMLVSTFTMLSSMAVTGALCLLDSRVVKKANKNIERDIDNGTLLAPYRENILAAKKLEAEKLAGILDKMGKKGETAAAFTAVATSAQTPEAAPAAQAPVATDNSPKR